MFRAGGLGLTKQAVLDRKQTVVSIGEREEKTEAVYETLWL